MFITVIIAESINGERANLDGKAESDAEPAETMEISSYNFSKQRKGLRTAVIG